MKRSGFALVAALWFVVLLSGLGLEVSLAGRDLRSGTLNAQDAFLARTSAQAGLEHARATLSEALKDSTRLAGALSVCGLGDPWRNLDGLSPEPTEIDGQRYAVELQDAAARLNVNSASEDELRRLFVALRIDARAADRLAQAICDWRDADDLHRARGAEVDAYLRDGARVLPSNRPLQDVSELRWIRGMTSTLYHRVHPSLNTEGSGRINLRSASRPVLLALSGMTEEAVDLILRVRRNPSRPLHPHAVYELLSTGARQVMLPHLPELVARTVSTTSEVRLVSTGWAQNGRAHVTVSALAVRAGDEMITSGRKWR